MELYPVAGPALPERPAPMPPEPDKRPTADASAIARDPTPEIPLVLPPAKRQDGLIGAAMLREAGSKGAELAPEKRVTEAERVLKPYGVAMLPAREDQMPAKAAPTDDAT